MIDRPRTESTGPNPSAADATMRMAKGAGLVVILLWSLISWAPAIDLLYDGNGTPAWLNWLFLAGSLPVLGTVWCVAYWALTRDGRQRLRDGMRDKAAAFTLYAAGWMIVYQVVA